MKKPDRKLAMAAAALVAAAAAAAVGPHAAQAGRAEPGFATNDTGERLMTYLPQKKPVSRGGS